MSASAPAGPEAFAAAACSNISICMARVTQWLDQLPTQAPAIAGPVLAAALQALQLVSSLCKIMHWLQSSPHVLAGVHAWEVVQVVDGQLHLQQASLAAALWQLSASLLGLFLMVMGRMQVIDSEYGPPQDMAAQLQESGACCGSCFAGSCLQTPTGLGVHCSPDHSCTYLHPGSMWCIG
jgi:hypothetical protein